MKTVKFSWEGARHQLDLCGDHLGQVESTVNAWLRGTAASSGPRRRARKAAATKRSAPASKRAAPRRSAAASSSNASRELRAWAKANGYNVSDRGRIPSEVRTAHEAATK